LVRSAEHEYHGRTGGSADAGSAPLISELNDVLGAVYEPHQRHGLSVEQLFEPHVRFFLARLYGTAVGCGGVALFDDYAEVNGRRSRNSGSMYSSDNENGSRTDHRHR
jgi:hypothetical protein